MFEPALTPPLHITKYEGEEKNLHKERFYVDETNPDVNEKNIQEIFKYSTDSNKLILCAYLFKHVAIKIPSHFERFMESCLNYYQIGLALNPNKINYNEHSNIIETIEEYLKDCSQLQQVFTTIRPIQDCLKAHPKCTKQILKLFNYELKYDGEDPNESNEENCLHAEEVALLEKLKNFKLIDLTEIVRLYQNDVSLKAFILFQIMKRAANRRFNLDPTLQLLSYLHILRSMNEMIERTNLQVIHLPFGHFFEHEKNVLVFYDYSDILSSVYCSLNSSFKGMENIVWTSIAKSSIPTLLKIENLIPNVEKSSYYADLSRLSYYTGDLIMEEEYVKKAKEFREERDKVYPYATD